MHLLCNVVCAILKLTVQYNVSMIEGITLVEGQTI